MDGRAGVMVGRTGSAVSDGAVPVPATVGAVVAVGSTGMAVGGDGGGVPVGGDGESGPGGKDVAVTGCATAIVAAPVGAGGGVVPSAPMQAAIGIMGKSARGMRYRRMAATCICKSIRVFR